MIPQMHCYQLLQGENYRETTEYSLGTLTPQERLFYAIQDGDVEGVRRLMHTEKDRLNDHYELNGETPLTYACSLGFDAIVRVLLESDAVDPNCPDDTGVFFPLNIAVDNGDVECVRELLKHPDIDPNVWAKPVFPTIWSSIYFQRSEIYEMLIQHPKIDLQYAWDFRHGTLIRDILGFGTPEMKRMSKKAFPINPKNEQSEQSDWTMLAVLPVSNDPDHSPPLDFVDGLDIITSELYRKQGVGELELDINRAQKLTRLIYKTDTYVALSLVKNNRPFGPTIYKPLSTMVKELSSCGNVWHIAARSLAENPTARFQILSDLAERKLVVFRSLNDDNDLPRILSGQPLRGRGSGRNIKKQVKGDDQELISASYELTSKFLNQHKSRKNGGYVAIFTKEGARRFINFKDRYPQFWSHGQVLEEVSGDQRLTKRAKGAKECLFGPNVPLDLVVVIDDGYPTASGRKRKRAQTELSPPRNVCKILKELDLTFSDLPHDLQVKMCSNSAFNARKNALIAYKEKKNRR